MDNKIYNIDFSGNKGSEINNKHYGIIYELPNVSNMVFCIPLTSPKKSILKTKTVIIAEMVES